MKIGEQETIPVYLHVNKNRKLYVGALQVSADIRPSSLDLETFIFRNSPSLNKTHAQTGCIGVQLHSIVLIELQ